MKAHLLVFTLLFSLTLGKFSTLKAQENTPKLWVKTNAASALVLIPQVGLEYHFKPAWSYQIDGTASFWKSFKGIPIQVGILNQEVRYYLLKEPKNMFIAGNLGLTVFKTQKWNYWNSDIYQKGFSGYAGLSLGYVWQIHDNLKAELFLGAGSHQARYKSFDKITGKRVDETAKGGWNKSGEFLPLRGGISLAIPIEKIFY